MLRNALTSAILALAASSTFGIVPARADALPKQERAAAAGQAVAQSRVFGPYATIRRANEVANHARRLGYRALAYHNGDGYYVRVW